MNAYTAILELADDGSWSGYFPDLPGCTSWGETREELVGNLPVAMSLWLEDAREDGDPIPRPRSQATLVPA